MRGQAEHLATEGIDDELEAGRLQCLNTFLNHMVTILVLHTLQLVAVRLLDDQLLLLQWNRLQSLLDDTQPYICSVRCCTLERSLFTSWLF